VKGGLRHLTWSMRRGTDHCVNSLQIAAFLALLIAADQATAAAPDDTPTCRVVQHPRDYRGRKFTVATDLVVDMRHGALLNLEGDPSCQGLRFILVPGTQAATAYREIEDAMLGVLYAQRNHHRLPKVWLYLRGIHVKAVGTMVCDGAGDARCQMHVTDLFDVTYPPSFPPEMRP